MHHAATEDFHPVIAFAEFHFIAGAVALDINFQGRFGEREEGRAETHVDLVDLEEGFAELFEHPFHVGDIGGLVDHKALQAGGTSACGSGRNPDGRSCRE